MTRRKPQRRRKLGWVAPHGLNPTFTERMEVARERAAWQRASGRSQGRRRSPTRVTAAQERKWLNEAQRKYMQDWAAESPCAVGRPDSGGCKTSGCCSWHRGVRYEDAPF